MRHRVLVAAALTDAALEVARARFDILYEPAAATEPGQMPSLAAAHNAVAVVLGSRTKVPASEIERLPKAVKMVATVSVGFDHIDLAAARAAGLIVTNTPDVLTNATADITLFLMLGALRRGKEYAQIMTDGWRRSFGLTEMLGLDANGRTLGIVGMGRIGQAVAHRARAFGMTISYHNRNRLPPEQEGDAVYYPALDALLAQAQVLCLTAPGGSAPLITAEKIALLPKGAVLVNSGRGTLVDDDALIAALQSGHVAAAGLDVFKGEPAFDLRYNALPNVFMTPHMGSATLETRTAMGMRALDNVFAVLDGRPALDLVT